MKLRDTLNGLALAAVIGSFATGPAVAAGGTCGFPTGPEQWTVTWWQGDEELGWAVLGETPSGLVVEGVIDGIKFGYRMKNCLEGDRGLLTVTEGEDIPEEMVIHLLEDQISMTFEDEEGDGGFFLTRP